MASFHIGCGHLGNGIFPKLVPISWARAPIGRGRLSLPVLDVAGLAARAGRMTDDMLDKLFPMGPWRRPPQRWYIFTGTRSLDVGYSGDLLPDLLYRQPELVIKANEWLSRLDLGYQLIVTPIGGSDSDLFEVRLRDATRATGVNVALPDVGFRCEPDSPLYCAVTSRKRTRNFD